MLLYLCLVVFISSLKFELVPTTIFVYACVLFFFQLEKQNKGVGTFILNSAYVGTYFFFKCNLYLKILLDT